MWSDGGESDPGTVMISGVIRVARLTSPPPAQTARPSSGKN